VNQGAQKEGCKLMGQKVHPYGFAESPADHGGRMVLDSPRRAALLRNFVTGTCTFRSSLQKKSIVPESLAIDRGTRDRFA